MMGTPVDLAQWQSAGIYHERVGRGKSAMSVRQKHNCFQNNAGQSWLGLSRTMDRL